jgi:hypothetical protein
LEEARKEKQAVKDRAALKTKIVEDKKRMQEFGDMMLRIGNATRSQDLDSRLILDGIGSNVFLQMNK